MVKVKALTERTIAERFAEIKDEESVWGDLSERSRALVEQLLSSSLEEELTARLAAAPYSRKEGRRGYRNGGYSRQLVSHWGLLDVWMPRARKNLPPSQVLGRFQRLEREVDQLIRRAFLRWVSTREARCWSRSWVAVPALKRSLGGPGARPRSAPLPLAMARR